MQCGQTAESEGGERRQELALAGCDRLTISPKLLVEMDGMKADVPTRLDAGKAKKMDIPKAILLSYARPR